MSDRAVTLFVVLLVVGATAPFGALAAPDGGERVAGPVAGQPENDTGNDTAAFGASVSAFVQTSAVDAEGEVDNGVFTARFENASNETRDRLVRDRIDRLAERVKRLRDQRSALLNTTGNLTIAERARAARLVARIDSLQNTLNVTEEAARSAGVNRTRLATLRTQADELSGPEVAALARGLAGGPDRDRGNGPPANASQSRPEGPDGPSSEAPTNRSTGGETQGTEGPSGEDRRNGTSDDPDEKDNASDSDGDADQSDEDERGQGDDASTGTRGQGENSGNSGKAGQGSAGS